MNPRPPPLADDVPRREPSIGNLDEVTLRERIRPSFPSPSTMERWRWWAVGGVGLLLVLLVLFLGPLSDRVMPQTRAQGLVEQADRALAAGHLTAADGSGAKELYEAAAAIDPDRIEARAGLARVAEQALARAQAALQEGRIVDAHASLQLARELSVPRDAADALAARLREREAAMAGVDALLAQAEQARLADRFEGDDGAALPLYARVLALEPRNAGALRGREDAIGAMLDDARERLRSGDVGAAAAAIATANRYDAGHVDLPDTRARLTEELAALRRRADADLERGRIERAVAAWQALLVMDPGDAHALAGLQRAALAYAAQARRFAGDFRFAEADASLHEAVVLAPDHEAVRAAQAQVERSRQARAGAGVAMPAAQRRQRVTTLLQQAEAAERRGDLMSPPGESAYDRVRAAQALAPGDAEVRRAVARLLPSARRCFDAGLSANDLGRTRGCLDARDVLGDDSAALAQAGRQLAQRWLAIGDERLAAGQLNGARAALESARAIDPGVPGLTVFAERLRTASGQ